MIVELGPETDGESVARRIARVPGVHAVALAFRTSQSWPDVLEAVDAALREVDDLGAFRVEARRSNTDFATGSQEIARRIGSYVQERTGAPVDLSHPDTVIGVLMNRSDAFVWSSRILGVGGLPVGSAGRIVSLLSSGIDSPVATWQLMHRGAVVIGVHFSGRPQVDDSSERLVARLGEMLAETGGLGRIYIVPFGDLQKEISLLSPPDLRVLLYRRLMFRVAERIASVENGKALLTGESLGQVASQTLENIRAVDDIASLPVFRPLIGTDKLEIMRTARELGTYDLSIEDASDCCTLFMPRSPETHARLDVVREAWDALDTERMENDALAVMEWLDFACPAYRPPRVWPTPAGERGWSVAQIAASASHAPADA